jgi:hypothetical protein
VQTDLQNQCSPGGPRQTDRPADDVLEEIVDINREHYRITFTFEEYNKTEDDTSFGDVLYTHSWNDAGRFRLQVSLRERPTLPVLPKAMLHQAYFNYLEFELFDVRAMETIEMLAEKVRAALQRVKVRDLYDLHRFSTTPFDGELLRQLAVLKLWQARDPFDPDVFFQKLRRAAISTGPISTGCFEQLRGSSPRTSCPTSNRASTSSANSPSSNSRSSPTRRVAGTSPWPNGYAPRSRRRFEAENDHQQVRLLRGTRWDRERARRRPPLFPETATRYAFIAIRRAFH